MDFLPRFHSRNLTALRLPRKASEFWTYKLACDVIIDFVRRSNAAHPPSPGLTGFVDPDRHGQAMEADDGLRHVTYEYFLPTIDSLGSSASSALCRSHTTRAFVWR